MKKLLLILFCLPMLTLAQQTYVPDDNFEQELINKGYDTVLDDSVTTANINTATFLDVSNQGISDLTGIEDFIALTWLACFSNQLDSLDVSSNTALTHLFCEINQLTSLDVSANIALYALNCGDNLLTSLDVRNGNNDNFTVFDAVPNPNLTCISVDDALWSTTNWTVVNGNIDPASSFAITCSDEAGYTNVPDDNFEQALITLGYDNFLDDYVFTASIDTVAHLYNLYNLSIADLTGIEDFTALTYLHCNDNQLTSLDVTQNTFLTYLMLENNQLASLDVSQNIALTSLDLGGNQLTSLDVTQNTALHTLHCAGNLLTSLDVRNGNNINFSSFEATTNPNLTCISVDDAEWSATNWTNIDNASSFGITCSPEPGYTYVPDDNFEQRLILLGYDNYVDDYVVTDSINTLDSLSVTSLGIADLTGIEDFTALTQLDCNNNQLTSLDVSNNTALTVLKCRVNQLTSLDVITNTALTDLDCESNLLNSLDVTLLSLLERLRCQFNNLLILDVSQNTALTWLDCAGNQITNLDVSQNISLGTLWARDNFLISVDVTNNDDLTSFSVAGNNLLSLDVSQNAILQTLWCRENQLTSLDVSQNTALTYLQCFGNLLTSLEVRNGNNVNFTYFDATNNPNLTCISVDDAEWSATNWTNIDNASSFGITCSPEPGYTYVPDNNFEQALITLGYDNFIDHYVFTDSINTVDSLNVSSLGISDLTGIEDFTALTYLDCYNNQLTSLDVSNNTALTLLGCSQNQLTSLDVNQNIALINLYCFNNPLDSLDVSSNIALTNLSCGDNLLTSLDVSNNTVLDYLDCFNNQLDSLDVSSNITLTNLSCGDNLLTSLDVSNNTALTYLNCYDNQLDSLDVSSNIALTSLSCQDNKLTSLDVSANTALIWFTCGNNQLTSLDLRNGNNTYINYFDATNNPNLTCIDVDDPAYSTANWTGIDAWASFDGSCSGFGCIDPMLCNYNPYATIDDGSCIFPNGCTNPAACNYDSTATCDDGSCLTVYGCTDLTACNYNQAATCDDGSCNLPNGCGDLLYLEYDPLVTCSDSNSCITLIINGCMDPTATNYNPLANVNSYCNYGWTIVPDDNFEQALTNLGIDTDGLINDSVETDNIRYLTYLNVSNQGIADLTGIEDFTALDSLYCYDNQLTSLDVSANSALTRLNCYENQLTTLDLSANTALTELRCYDNQLTSLDVRNGNNTNFTYFKATTNLSLTCISVDDALWSTANWTVGNDNIDPGMNFYTDNNTPEIVTSCDDYTWNGTTYNTGGVYTKLTSNLNGCDSTLILFLHINNSTTSIDTRVHCDTYTWLDGVTYTTSNNSATFTSTNAAGCDNVATLDLTINNSTTSTDTQVHCDTFTWIDGNTYTVSDTTATMNYTNSVSCDSTVTLNLTIKNSATSTDMQVHCDTYTWLDGVTYTASNNSATMSYTNAVNCDSTVTLDLTITGNPVVTIAQNGVNLTATASPSLSVTYLWNTGETTQVITPTVSGPYWCTVIDANGCEDESVHFNYILIAIDEENISDLSLYPNPTKGMVNIVFSSNYSQYLQVRMVNLIGEELINEHLEQFVGEYTKQIDLSNNAKGIYFLEIETNDGVINKKLILQ